ncbi:TPA: hypothetical protein HA273_05535 [Candidatus Bathyarchaeota archaeon]|nr:hypothetical protein [Candidatus Bathyarchaeota archaeon]
MDFDKKTLTKKALLIVAASFLLYNVYQAITTTIFVFHFPLVINQLPNLIESSRPSLQLALFIIQEIAGSVGSYLRLIGAIFAVNCALLLIKNDARYIERLSKLLLFEALYFLLLLPAAINHIVGSVISYSAFLNFYAGVSCLLQAALLFPPLFILSHKLRKPQDRPPILKWAVISAPLYVLVLWIKHGLFWLYALSSSGPQQTGFIEAIGSVNSLLTLLVAAMVATITSISYWPEKKLNTRLVTTALLLVGAYFAIYALVSVWIPIYLSFIPLTDFWLITLLILGIALLRDSSRLSE